MNEEPVIVTNFVIYQGEYIVCQCGFQVLEVEKLNVFPSTDGGEFAVAHSYQGSVCSVDLSYRKGGKLIHSLKLEMPINKTKIKWKEAKFGEEFRLFYSSGVQPSVKIRRPI